jgi:uracil-DNA glycosylase
MKITDAIRCPAFSCTDIDKTSYILPSLDLDPGKIKILMITEAPPENKSGYFYAAGNPFYLQTTLQAFKDAGANVGSMQDILGLGVYITTAIKCAKLHYALSPETMNNCSLLLEREVSLFPDVKAYMLMGDVAIKMMNDIWKKQTGKKALPPGATYKLRKQAYYIKDKRVFPSYTPAGKNFLIEKSKRKMVTEDIHAALSWIR